MLAVTFNEVLDQVPNSKSPKSVNRLILSATFLYLIDLVRSVTKSALRELSKVFFSFLGGWGLGCKITISMRGVWTQVLFSLSWSCGMKRDRSMLISIVSSTVIIGCERP